MQAFAVLLLATAVSWQSQALVRDKQGKVIPWWQRWKSLSANERIYYGHNLKGNKYVEHHDFQNALSEYNEMIRLSPKFPDGYNMRAMLYYRMHKYDLAIADWNKSIPLEKRPMGAAASYYNRGLNYRMKGNMDRAIADFTESLKQGDINSDAYRLRGEMYLNKNQFEQAIADFSQAIKLNPRSVESYLKRAVAYSRIRQYVKAANDTTIAVKERPGDAEVNGNHAWALYEAGRLDQAIEYNKRALAISPSLGYVLYNQGLCYAAKDDWTSAQRYYQIALARSPGESRPAMDDIRIALKAKPRSPGLRQAESFLSQRSR